MKAKRAKPITIIKKIDFSRILPRTAILFLFIAKVQFTYEF